jgi:putative serine protease PepD
VSVASVAALVAPSTVAVEVNTFLAEGAGSGVVYGNDGYIITNHHVIEGASEVAVVFADGARFPARIVGSDPVTDIGVLLVDRQDVTPVTIGDSELPTIGEPTVAVGNPLALAGGPTVTAGIISALERKLTVTDGNDLYGLVQTDAPIAPGSSGGALVDASGRLVGITTAIAVSMSAPPTSASPSRGYRDTCGQRPDRDREVRRPHGIQGETAWAEENGAEFPVGILVNDVSQQGAYEVAGGQINDVIVAIDDVTVNTIDALLARLRRLRERDTVPVRILRSDASTTIDVTMGGLD